MLGFRSWVIPRGMPKVRGAGCGIALPKVRDTTRIPQISTRILGIYPAA
jgi:hypothetical protein